MILDPTLFSITQSKEMGLWPPSDTTSHGIIPYMKRMKSQELIVLDVGIMKGENSYHLIESVPNIKTVYGIISYEDGFAHDGYEDLVKRNLTGNEKFSLDYDDREVDVVCFHHNANPNVLSKYYEKLKSNGIFSGSEHSLTKVKEFLSKFRRGNKIGTPINVSNGCWFWVKR